MKTFYFLKGIPASGKSTWKESMLSAEWVSKDDLRRAFPNDSEKEILKREREMVAAMLDGDRDVVVDNTHFNPIHEEYYRPLAEYAGFEFVVKEFRTPLDECLKRNRKRTGTKRVPDKAIYDMAKQSGWYEDELRPFNTDKSKPHVVCVDIDGTVALMDGRSPYDYSKVSEDLPNEPVVTLVRDIAQNTRIMFVSGRPDSCRNETLEWLDNNVVGEYLCWDLLMRKTGDKRPDFVVKEEIYREICDDYYVDYVIDDRTQVVARLRALGFTVLQVAD